MPDAAALHTAPAPHPEPRSRVAAPSEHAVAGAAFEVRLRTIVTAAASFEDGTRTEFFAPEAGPAAADSPADRARVWLERAATTPAAADALIAQLSAVGRPFAAAVGPVRLRDGVPLPDWAEALRTFLLAQPPRPVGEPEAEPVTPAAGSGADASATRGHAVPGAPVDTTADTGAVRSTADVMRAAAELAAPALLPRDSGAVHGVAVDDAAWSGMVSCLAYRLDEVCRGLLRAEWAAAKPTGAGAAVPTGTTVPAGPPSDVTRDGWLDRFEAYPGLARAVGTACRQWAGSLGELFTRLAADWDLLRAELWGGARPGPLTDFRGEAGDRHADGRSVALLEFGGGHGVVYKPKDQRHAAAFRELVSFLNSRGLQPDLPVYTVLTRDGYGWEQRIVPEPCRDDADFGRFYCRLGAFVRLFQLLEAQDMWADNLIAAGDNPYFIDVECLLTPRLRLPEGARYAQLAEALAETVVPIATLHQPWLAFDGSPLLDVGCLSKADDPTDTAGRPLLPLPKFRPWHAGGAADPVRYASDVTRGYTRMQHALAAARTELARPDGPLAGFRDVPVRYIWRSTSDCYRMLDQSLRPRHLTTGAGRDLALAGLLRAPLRRPDTDSCRPGSIDVALAEIDALNRLDVPLFRSVTTSRSAFAADGREIPEHFAATAWDRLQQRVAALDRFPLRDHTDLVTACLDAAAGGAPDGAGPPPEHNTRRNSTSSPDPSAQQLLDAAVRVGDDVLAARRRSDGQPGWIGLSWFPVTGLRQVEVLSTDLLNGLGGIGVLLADLWAATGETRFRDAAQEVLATGYDVISTSITLAPGSIDRRVAGMAPVPGGFAGPGAYVHALARCADTLGDPQLVDHARMLVPAAVALARPGESYTDLPVGIAGLLLNLLRLRRAATAAGAGGHPATDEAIGSLVRLVHAGAGRARPGREGSGRTAGGPLAELAPVGADSMVLALARALAEAPDLVDAHALRTTIAAHRFDTAARSGRLALLDTMIALGGAGEPLGRELAVPSDGPGGLPGHRAAAAPAGAPATPPQLPDPGAMSSRHLLAEAGERLLAQHAAALRTDRPVQPPRQRTAAPLLAELLARREATGRWLPDRLAADRTDLNSLVGLVAVGLLLVQGTTPSPAPLTVLR